MKTLIIAVTAVMALASPALAIDPSPEAISSTYKPNKTLHADDVAALMRTAERWCYNEEAGSCDWAEIYLSAETGSAGIAYEALNTWDADRNIVFVDKAEFRDQRYVCEYGYDNLPSLRASRADGTAIGGRELEAFRLEIRTSREGGTDDCFDYVYVSYDAAAATMQLKQRQYVGGVVNPAMEAAITLHFNAEDAAALTTY